MKKQLLVIILVVLMTGCGAYNLRQAYMPQDIDYIDRAMATETTFKVDENQLPEISSRAQYFISKYASEPLAVASWYVVETLETGNVARVNYVMRAKPVDGKYEVTALCEPVSICKQREAVINEHIFSYYLQTGDEPHNKYLVYK